MATNLRDIAGEVGFPGAVQPLNFGYGGAAALPAVRPVGALKCAGTAKMKDVTPAPAALNGLGDLVQLVF